MLLLTVLCGVAVGISLGLTGGGGSILAVPLLVYILASPPKEAVSISLGAVGATSLVGAAGRLFRGEVEVKTGLLFAVSGVAGAPLGTWIGSLLSETLLLVLFAALMVVVAVQMWTKASKSPAEAAVVRVPVRSFPPQHTGPACQRDPSGQLPLTSRCLVVLLVSGVLTGVLSGLFGVGGGFVIVPALVLLTSLDIHRAVATSLMVIALISGAGLKARLGDEPQIHASGLGGKQWTPPYADHVVQDGDEVKLGGVRLRAIHTPGHTPEHVSWALFDDTRSEEVPWLLFTGDFLFVGDVGRPDLLGEEERKGLAVQLYQSVFQTMEPIPDFTEIYPGHGAGSLCGKAIGSRRSSTIGFERRFNGALQSAPEEKWTATLLKGMPLAPPYFRRMKQINSQGPKILGPELPGQKRFTSKDLHERLCENCLVVDVRSKEAFAAAHIPGSVNIPLGPNLPTWAGWVLPYDRSLVIVADHTSEVPEVVTHLIRVGLDDIQGYLDDGMDAWENHGYQISRLRTLSVHDLAGQLKSGDGQPFVLDVRTDSEWDAGHIDGAKHIHGGLLKERFGEVPKDRSVAVICGSGYRGSIAASFLKREGYERVANVLGGMTAWKNTSLPTVT